MAYKKKTWSEKLVSNDSKFPKVLKLEPNFPCGKALIKWGAKKGDSVVIAKGFDVNELMSKVPRGKIITIKELCEKLAKKYKTKWCCPLVAGIHVVIAAQAAIETKSSLPWWRTLKSEGELNPKYPPGQKELLEKEGHKVIARGKRFFVQT